MLAFSRDLLSPLLNLGWFLGCLVGVLVHRAAVPGGGVVAGAGGGGAERAGAARPGGRSAERHRRHLLPAGRGGGGGECLGRGEGRTASRWGGGVGRRRRAGRPRRAERGLSVGALAVVGLAAGLAAGTKLNFLLPAAVLVVGLAAIAPQGPALARALGPGRRGAGRRRLLVPAQPRPQRQPAALDPPPRPDHAARARAGAGRPRSPHRPLLPDRRHRLVGLVPPRPPRRPLDRLARPRPGRPRRPAPRPPPMPRFLCPPWRRRNHGIVPGIPWFYADAHGQRNHGMGCWRWRGSWGWPRRWPGWWRRPRPRARRGCRAGSNPASATSPRRWSSASPCSRPRPGSAPGLASRRRAVELTSAIVTERTLEQRWARRHGSRAGARRRSRVLVGRGRLPGAAALPAGPLREPELQPRRGSTPPSTGRGTLSGARIATTSTRQYPLFGTDLSNRVEFVGVERAARRLRGAADLPRLAPPPERRRLRLRRHHPRPPRTRQAALPADDPLDRIAPGRSRPEQAAHRRLQAEGTARPIGVPVWLTCPCPVGPAVRPCRRVAWGTGPRTDEPPARRPVRR